MLFETDYSEVNASQEKPTSDLGSIMDSMRRLIVEMDLYEEDDVDEEVEDEPSEEPDEERYADILHDPLVRDANPVHIKPCSFHDSPQILEYIREGRAVLMFGEDLDWKMHQRVLDFVSGGLYYAGGKILSLRSSAYLITPASYEYKKY